MFRSFYKCNDYCIKIFGWQENSIHPVFFNNYCAMLSFFSLNNWSYYFPRDTIPLVPSSVLSYLLHTYGALLQLYTKTISHTGTTSSSAEGCQDGWCWRRLDWKQLKQKGNWNTKLHLRCSGPHWLIKPNAEKECGALSSAAGRHWNYDSVWQAFKWPRGLFNTNKWNVQRNVCVYKYSSYTCPRLK